MEANKSFNFPETSVRFGIASKTELRFAAPDYFFNGNTASGFANRFGDLSLGFKQQLGPTWGRFDVSLIPSVSLPGSELDIKSWISSDRPTSMVAFADEELDGCRNVLPYVANRGSAAKLEPARPACIFTGRFDSAGTLTSNIQGLLRNAAVRNT